MAKFEWIIFNEGAECSDSGVYCNPFLDWSLGRPDRLCNREAAWPKSNIFTCSISDRYDHNHADIPYLGT